MLKDYYAILELPVTATIPEIKKAYRKLVMLYHPDKTGADTYSAAHFNEIKEAYEVLTNSTAKEQYLQQRWLKKAAGAWMPDEPITPPIVLKQALELNKSISLLNVHRMDATNVAQRILQIIPTPTIEKMKSFNEPEINAAILTTLLQATSVLPLQQTEMVTDQLRILAGTNTEEQIKIDRVLLQKKKQEDWERRKIWLILIAVVALCLLIYWSGKT
ncbi:J domain-containing protein [Lacibacter sp. MH-610]|uniref:J domain-containing protein n=1 Tax=Lacibacter sp. MH-610 TaxID=3020883 RepID=UPI003891E0E2